MFARSGKANDGQEEMTGLGAASLGVVIILFAFCVVRFRKAANEEVSKDARKKASSSPKVVPPRKGGGRQRWGVILGVAFGVAFTGALVLVLVMIFFAVNSSFNEVSTSSAQSASTVRQENPTFVSCLQGNNTACGTAYNDLINLSITDDMGRYCW